MLVPLGVCEHFFVFSTRIPHTNRHNTQYHILQTRRGKKRKEEKKREEEDKETIKHVLRMFNLGADLEVSWYSFGVTIGSSSSAFDESPEASEKMKHG